MNGAHRAQCPLGTNRGAPTERGADGGCAREAMPHIVIEMPKNLVGDTGPTSPRPRGASLAAQRLGARASALALIVPMTACTAGYRPGALLAAGSGAHAQQIGCLDVAAAIDAIGDPRVPAESALVTLDFGNRCDRPVRFDVRRMRVTAGALGGAVWPLVAFDPRAELRPAVLDAHARGHETIRFDPPAGAGGPTSGAPPVQVCVDLRALVDGVDAAAPRVCLQRIGEPSVRAMEGP